MNWGKNASVRSGNGSLGVAQSSVLGVGDLLDSSDLGVSWSGELNTLASLSDVLGDESASWGSDLSDLVRGGVVRGSSSVGYSDVSHGFIIFVLLIFDQIL